MPTAFAVLFKRSSFIAFSFHLRQQDRSNKYISLLGVNCKTVLDLYRVYSTITLKRIFEPYKRQFK